MLNRHQHRAPLGLAALLVSLIAGACHRDPWAERDRWDEKASPAPLPPSRPPPPVHPAPQPRRALSPPPGQAIDLRQASSDPGPRADAKDGELAVGAPQEARKPQGRGGWSLAGGWLADGRAASGGSATERAAFGVTKLVAECPDWADAELGWNWRRKYQSQDFDKG
jgi:hypothetical protein